MNCVACSAHRRHRRQSITTRTAQRHPTFTENFCAEVRSGLTREIVGRIVAVLTLPGGVRYVSKRSEGESALRFFPGRCAAAPFDYIAQLSTYYVSAFRRRGTCAL